MPSKYPSASQMTLTKEDREALRLQVHDDWFLDSTDNEKLNRMRKRAVQLWDAATDVNTFPEHEKSNFHVPLTQWQILAKLVKEVDALLGDEAEVVVRPIGPADAKLAPKISRYMNWWVKVTLKLFKKLYDYLQQKIVMGTAIAFLAWQKKERKVKELVPRRVPVTRESVDQATGLPITVPDFEVQYETVEKSVTDSEGPELCVENLEDWAVPVNSLIAENSIGEIDHFERRLKLTVDQLLDMADEGKLDEKVLKGESLAKLRRFAETGQFLDETTSAADTGKQVRDEKERLAGTDGLQSRDERLTVINWFGRFRKKTAKDDERSEETVAFYQPETNLLLGASRLVDMYPDGRRPFIKSEMVRNLGSFWGKGLPEFLESINNEMDIQHNAITDAAVLALNPTIFYSPAAGVNFETFRIESGTAVPCADPSKIVALNFANINMSPAVVIQNHLLNFAENISGLTQVEMGRPFQQPNAPRTLGQQQLLQVGSGIRQLLDLRLERENLRELLNRIWDLDRRYLPDAIYFRVTEDAEPEMLSKEEMQGNYDFDIGPLTSTANKQQKQMEFLQSYALLAASPAVAQSPALRVELDKEVLRNIGRADLANLLPDTEAMAPPKSPEQENALMGQGQDVDPHPGDNHQQHIAKHTAILDNLIRPSVEEGILPASVIANFESHLAEHEKAMAGGMMGTSSPVMGRPNGGMGGNVASDQTGVPNDAMNTLKQALNFGGQNIA